MQLSIHNYTFFTQTYEKEKLGKVIKEKEKRNGSADDWTPDRRQKILSLANSEKQDESCQKCDEMKEIDASTAQ